MYLCTIEINTNNNKNPKLFSTQVSISPEQSTLEQFRPAIARNPSQLQTTRGCTGHLSRNKT
jgi:hypothetical protein